MDNSSLAFEYGDRVASSIQVWIKDNLCFGLLSEDELPFADYTVNPLVVKIKPNGALRVCIKKLAMYAHPNGALSGPTSVNKGVDQSLFHTPMGSMRSFAIAMHKAVCPAVMCKMDWKQGVEHTCRLDALVDI